MDLVRLDKGIHFVQLLDRLLDVLKYDCNSVVRFDKGVHIRLNKRNFISPVKDIIENTYRI